ncbi:hypothetical protein C0J26_22565 [Pseudomonas baetica]|nr:hypothetical protein C0J26_22565 [Pseudomonas baetica]
MATCEQFCSRVGVDRTSTQVAGPNFLYARSGGWECAVAMSERVDLQDDFLLYCLDEKSRDIYSGDLSGLVVIFYRGASSAKLFIKS